MINITLEEARELYNQGSLSKEIALRAFPEEEIVNDYRLVTSLPEKTDCKTDKLYARLITAYKQMSKGRKVDLTTHSCYLPKITMSSYAIPERGNYKCKVEIDGKVFFVYTEVELSCWYGRLGFEDGEDNEDDEAIEIIGGDFGSDLLPNTWAFREKEQAIHFVNLFYEELITVSLGDMYNVIFLLDERILG